MSRNWSVCIVPCLATLLALTPAMAQISEPAPATAGQGAVPRLIRFNGLLGAAELKPGGGLVGVEFAIYKEETGGVALWSEIQNVEPDSTGHFTVLLGSTKNGGLPPDVLGFGEPRWLSVTPVGGQAQPPVLLVSVPYALRAEEAVRIAGSPASDFVRKDDLTDSVREAIRTIQPDAATAHATPSASSGPTAFTGSTTNQIVSVQQTGTGKAILATAASGVGTSSTGGTAGVVGSATAAKGVGVEGVATLTTGGASIGVSGVSSSSAGTGVSGKGSAFGVTGTAANAGGIGVKGTSTDVTDKTGIDFGVQGIASDSTGAGVNGTNKALTGNAFGVSGNTSSTSTNAAAVNGVEGATTGQVYGVNGTTNSTGQDAAGVNGTEGATTGQVYGVSGSAQSTTNLSAGVMGNENATTGQVFGVGGITTSTGNGSAGVIGYEQATTGQVYGVGGLTASTTNGSAAVNGNEQAATGVVYGVSGSTASTSTNAAGVSGFEGATSGEVFGVTGSTNSPTSGSSGVNGYEGATSGGPFYGGSFYAAGTGGIGVFGSADATSGFAIGVEGATQSPAGAGGQFVNLSGSGLVIEGQGANFKTVFTVDASGNGTFAGNLNVTGTITGSVKNFKIDDPLDPARKSLYHASVESSEMTNIYSGNVTLDRKGQAVVDLPEWFEALNGDFRYQLTTIGRPASVFIAQEIQNHQFKIAGGRAGLKVSWQVTGVRHDAWAQAHPLQVEEEKPQR